MNEAGDDCLVVCIWSMLSSYFMMLSKPSASLLQQVEASDVMAAVQNLSLRAL